MKTIKIPTMAIGTGALLLAFTVAPAAARSSHQLHPPRRLTVNVQLLGNC